MPKETKEQKETVGRVTHEYKHGELETGTGKPVKSRRQAVAIALHEAGASNQESPEKNREAPWQDRKAGEGRPSLTFPLFSSMRHGLGRKPMQLRGEAGWRQPRYCAYDLVR